MVNEDDWVLLSPTAQTNKLNMVPLHGQGFWSSTSVAGGRRQEHSVSGNAMIHLFQKGKKGKRERKGGGNDRGLGRTEREQGKKVGKENRAVDTMTRTHYVHSAVLRALHILSRCILTVILGGGLNWHYSPCHRWWNCGLNWSVHVPHPAGGRIKFCCPGV